MSLDTRTNEKLVRGFVDDILTQHRLERIDMYLASDFLDHHPWAGFPPDREGFSNGLSGFLGSFPDLRCDVDDAIVAGDTVVTRSRLSGTNTGAFIDQPASGAHIEIEAIDIYRIANSRIAEHWGLV